jgi:outer membrane protein assembly factor BamD
MSYMKILAFSLICFLLSCKSQKKDESDIISPAAEIYNNAIKLLEAKKPKKAAEEFANVYYQHPGSAITSYAELMEGYSYYLDKQFEDCVDVIEVFIKLHPAHEDIAYAYYLKALAMFMQISDVYYDQSKTLDAKLALQEVINKFPSSPYANDAMLKLEIIDDYLAAQNMEIGRYYLDVKNDPIAAIGRFKEVSNSNTNQTPEALFRLIESFSVMGMDDEAIRYKDNLLTNFPNNEWSTKANKKYKLN